uniref:Protein-serine/threonine kinase n=2 Tax=Chrysotila carterae TaxID=13221 RepID=A0A7S4ERM9_CHRCT|mmetsp:Transcript_707/g.1442  ORF Transcript_707/g.1442 Transcript_707/m.1442 type:complete len:337 (+) Transcript_707:356-1366(+)
MVAGAGQQITLKQLANFATAKPTHHIANLGAVALHAVLRSRLAALQPLAALVDQQRGSPTSKNRFGHCSHKLTLLQGAPDHVSWQQTFGETERCLRHNAAELVHDLITVAPQRDCENYQLQRSLVHAAVGTHLCVRDIIEQQGRVSRAAASGADSVDSVVMQHAHVQPLLDAVVSAVRETHPNVAIEMRGDTKATATCVPWQLQVAFMELLSNAVEASRQMEHHSPIRVTVSSRRGQIGIQVSDGAGGLEPGEVLPHALLLGYSTRSREVEVDFPSLMGLLEAGPVRTWPAGLGMGLPVARLHARYMGGDVVLGSVFGMGTDALMTFCSQGSRGGG